MIIAFSRKLLMIGHVQLYFVCVTYIDICLLLCAHFVSGACKGTQKFAREFKNIARRRKKKCEGTQHLARERKAVRSPAICAFHCKVLFSHFVTMQSLFGLPKYCVPTQKKVCEATQTLQYYCVPSQTFFTSVPSERSDESSNTCIINLRKMLSLRVNTN